MIYLFKQAVKVFKHQKIFNKVDYLLKFILRFLTKFLMTLM